MSFRRRSSRHSPPSVVSPVHGVPASNGGPPIHGLHGNGPPNHGALLNGPPQPCNGFAPSSNQYALNQQQQQQQLQMVETKYLVTRPGPMGSQGQAASAASFFAKANQGRQRLCHQWSLECDRDLQSRFQTTYPA